MQKTLSTILLLAIVVYAAACAFLFLQQRSLIYFPPAKAALQAPKTSTMTVPGALIKISERPHPGKHALIYLGGNGEDVSMSLPLLAQAFPAHALYLLHYRGFTGSTGTSTEQALVGRSLGTGIAVKLP